MKTKNKIYNYTENNHCSCGKLINNQASACKSCALKKYYKEYPKSPEKYHCMDCKVEIGYNSFHYGSKRCLSCALKYYFKKHPEKWPKGVYCLDCGKEISRRAKRCLPCAQKYKWKQSWYIKLQMKMRNLSPNKIEKQLNKLLQEILFNEYKYVGNGEFILGGFCPDFININGQKKIIELFGDYWHNLSKVKEKDKIKRKIYRKLGYELLIIWEHEIRDLGKVKNKVLKFNGK